MEPRGLETKVSIISAQSEEGGKSASFSGQFLFSPILRIHGKGAQKNPTTQNFSLSLLA